jgi:hypothetical protein
MGLSGQQRKKLQLALIDAFPTSTSLEQMLLYELDKSLRAIAGEGSLQDIVFRLIQAADSQGWAEELIRAACGSNPGNLQLKTIAEELLAIVQYGSVKAGSMIYDTKRRRLDLLTVTSVFWFFGTKLRYRFFYKSLGLHR